MAAYTLYRYIDRYLGILLCVLLYPFSFLRHRQDDVFPKSSPSILFIKIGLLGDAVLLIPTLRNLRRRFPHSRICMLCSSLNSQIFQRCPYVDDVIVINVSDILNIYFLLTLINKLRKKHFDIVIDGEQWIRITAILAFFASGGQRIGFKTKGQHKHYLFSDKVDYPQDIHEVEAFLRLLKPLGISEPDSYLELWCNKQEEEEADRIMQSSGLKERFVILHPGVSTSGMRRRWPFEYFLELAKMLKQRYGFMPVFTLPFKDMPLEERVRREIEDAVLLVALPIFVLAKIISQASFLVSANTGIMHLATAVGTPVVAINGPTDVRKWGPYSGANIVVTSPLPCSPCLLLGFEYGCRAGGCMQAIKPPDVMKRIEAAWRQNIQRGALGSNLQRQ